MDNPGRNPLGIRPSRFTVGSTVEGRYTIHRELGRGGFGTVYLVTQPDKSTGYALKVLHSEHQRDQRLQDMFRHEAETWIAMGQSPFVVRAHWIDQFESELCIVLEFIPPDQHGRISLSDYLASKTRPPVQQLMNWAVQCCLGMEHAFGHGLRCHRDLKPANVLISPDGLAKITDFGIAVLTVAQTDGSTSQGLCIVGTPEYMAPEAFSNPESVNEQSDIYSFGVMLFEMLAGERPFSLLSRSPENWYAIHTQDSIPDIDFPGCKIVKRCLAKRPTSRFPSFRDVRQALEQLCQQLNVPSVVIPSLDELNASDWNNKAMSLMMLERSAEALKCVGEALRLSPKFAKAWSNKGVVLKNLGAPAEECLTCYREALRLDGRLALPWHNMAGIYVEQGRLDEALHAFDQALALDPTYLPAWNDRAWTALQLGRVDESIQSLEYVVANDPGMAKAWGNLADAYARLHASEKALVAYDQALAINSDPEILARRAGLLSQLGRNHEAEKDYVRVIELDPNNVRAHYGLGILAELRHEVARAIVHYEAGLRANPENPNCWYAKGNILRARGDIEGAVQCFQYAIKYAPSFQIAWANLGACLSELGHDEDALRYLIEATRLNPEDPIAWWNRAKTEAILGKTKQAAESYRTVQGLASSFSSQMAQYAKEWLARHGN